MTWVRAVTLSQSTTCSTMRSRIKGVLVILMMLPLKENEDLFTDPNQEFIYQQYYLDSNGRVGISIRKGVPSEKKAGADDGAAPAPKRAKTWGGVVAEEAAGVAAEEAAGVAAEEAAEAGPSGVVADGAEEAAEAGPSGVVADGAEEAAGDGAGLATKGARYPARLQPSALLRNFITAMRLEKRTFTGTVMQLNRAIREHPATKDDAEERIRLASERGIKKNATQFLQGSMATLAGMKRIVDSNGAALFTFE
jgi:hypothetical protein